MPKDHTDWFDPLTEINYFSLSNFKDKQCLESTVGSLDILGLGSNFAPGSKTPRDALSRFSVL